MRPWISSLRLCTGMGFVEYPIEEGKCDDAGHVRIGKPWSK